jgi:enamine deaminase RidA (YjgF/YER057c/UK114 family)
MYEALFREIEEQGGRPSDIVTERVFLGDVGRESWPILEARRQVSARWEKTALHPVTTLVQQPPTAPGVMCEVQALAFLPAPGKTLTSRVMNDMPHHSSGRIVEVNGLRHLFVSNLVGDVDGDRLDFRGQADGMFRQADECLKREGMTFHDVVRTWICLSDIDRTYADLNASRRAYFRARSISPPPASTGIRGVPYPPWRDCCMDLRAIGWRGRLSVQPIHAPTLNEAPAYGSDFSRGTRVDYADRSLIYLSGTASIDTQGEVVHVGEIEAQVDRMLVNVEELFGAQGVGYEHVASAITYLKRPEFLDAFKKVAARRGLPETIPNTICVADICRPEWLCEMEAVAVLG